MAQYITTTSRDYDRAKDIWDATSHGDLSSLQGFMDNGALSINLALESDGQTPLHIAAKKGHIHIVRWIRNGRRERDMNLKLRASGFTPLHDVIFSLNPNNSEQMQPLLGANVQPTLTSSVEIVRELLFTGDTDANAIAGNNNYQMTPLHIAASKGVLEIVKLLLEWCPIDGICKNRRINVNAKDTKGSTALHLAAASGHVEVVEELLNYYKLQNPPLDIAPTNKRRATPLHVAAMFGMPRTVEILLKFDAPVNKTAFSGHTPLHYAVFAVCPKTVKTILQHSEGLKVSEADWKGLSPLEYAKQMCRNIPNNYVLEERKLLIQPGFLKDIVQYLEGFDVNALDIYHQRLLAFANAILVGAALIASITFSALLQPPLGFGKYDQDYVAINRPMVETFWVFNGFSFFFAIATVIAGAHAAFPKKYVTLRDTVETVRRDVLRASWLLLFAVIGVIGAFTCAGFADIPTSKYWIMSIPLSIGGLCCIWFLGDFGISLMDWDV